MKYDSSKRNCRGCLNRFPLYPNTCSTTHLWIRNYIFLYVYVYYVLCLILCPGSQQKRADASYSIKDCTLQNNSITFSALLLDNYIMLPYYVYYTKIDYCCKMIHATKFDSKYRGNLSSVLNL